MRGGGCQLAVEGIPADAPPFHHFIRVGVWCAVGGADEHMVQFVFDHAVTQLGPVGEREDLMQGAGEPHLLHEASFRGGADLFTRARVAAAGVGPETGGVVLAHGSPLQHEVATFIEDEHREGTVAHSSAMSLQLAQGAGVPVLVVNKHHFLASVGMQARVVGLGHGLARGQVRGGEVRARDIFRTPYMNGRVPRCVPWRMHLCSMRTTLFLISLLLIDLLHAQQWNWAADAGGGGNVDFCHDIATDGEGNAYWVGTVSGDVDFGCATLSTGNSDILGFVAKRAPDGTCVWVRGITVGFDEVWVFGIAIDHADRIYVTGRYNGNADFGDGVTLNSLGSDDIFLARYDTTGVCHWARRAGSSGSSDEARSVDVSVDGGIFLTGYSGGTTITFDAITIPNAGNFRQVVVARYDSLGTVQWAKASTGNGQGKSARAISVAGDRLFVTGQVGFSAATFDGVPLTPGPQGAYLYVLSADLDGNAQWARSYGTGDHEGMGISADTLGNVFVAGRMWGSLHLQDDTLTSVGSNDDMLVMKLDSAGGFHWARSTGSSLRDLSWGVAADGMGNAYFAGQFHQTIDYFGNSVTSLGGEDILISKLDGQGDVVWVARPSGFQRDVPLCIHRRAVAPHELYFGGYFWGAITYGSTTIDDVLNGDAMIVAGVDTTYHTSTYASPICPDACEGVAFAFAHGQGPFTYQWSNGANTASIGGLCEGEYLVAITDANDSVQVDTVLITARPDPGYTIGMIGDSLWVEGGVDFNWYYNGSAQVGDDSASHIAEATGLYHAMVTDEHGCIWSTDTVLVSMSGVPDLVQVPIRIWPVPAARTLHVELGGATGAGGLWNSTGRSVLSFMLRSGRNTIDVTALPPGVYLLRMADGRSARVVVE